MTFCLWFVVVEVATIYIEIVKQEKNRTIEITTDVGQLHKQNENDYKNIGKIICIKKGTRK